MGRLMKRKREMEALLKARSTPSVSEADLPESNRSLASTKETSNTPIPHSEDLDSHSSKKRHIESDKKENQPHKRAHKSGETDVEEHGDKVAIQDGKLHE